FVHVLCFSQPAFPTELVPLQRPTRNIRESHAFRILEALDVVSVIFKAVLEINIFVSLFQVRNNFRHYFLQPPQLKLLYDIVTWIVTQIAISYTVVPFVLLSIKPSFMFYSSWYYSLHSLGILVLLLLPVKKTPRGKNTHENAQLSRSKKLDEGENSLGQNSFSTTNSVCSQSQEVASRHSSLKH
uniref:Membrane bound O-acyltransferase domain containing 2 n=1 Tax=Sus scrofa TaxID=9823 RepID=A0A8D1I1B0_PIG